MEWHGLLLGRVCPRQSGLGPQRDSTRAAGRPSGQLWKARCLMQGQPPTVPGRIEIRHDDGGEADIASSPSWLFRMEGWTVERLVYPALFGSARFGSWQHCFSFLFSFFSFFFHFFHFPHFAHFVHPFSSLSSLFFFLPSSGRAAAGRQQGGIRADMTAEGRP